MIELNKSRCDQVFMDVGSTIIKYVRFNESDEITDGGYFSRDYNIIVGEQARDILLNQLGFDSDHDKARICSSANGGLRIGVIGYTERYSARWAERAAFNAGANVIWSTSVDEWGNTSNDTVDILVLAGGFDSSPIDRQILWLKNIMELPIITDLIIFAGNIGLHDKVRRFWPNAILVNNVIGEDLSWCGDELTGVLREAYLRDLVDKKGISSLQRFSEVPVMPTPAVVEKAFNAIVNDKTDIHIATPMLLLDVGGATTDAFYGGELIAEEYGNTPHRPINRFVFTNFGLSASRKTLLECLSLSDGLADFLRELYPDNYERRYIAIREGNWDETTKDFLAETCVYLALKSCGEGLLGNHRLELNKVASLIITGGASQLCEKERLVSIAKLCGLKHSTVQVDKDYTIWMEGMTQLSQTKTTELTYEKKRNI
jgi:hypothetical protein